MAVPVESPYRHPRIAGRRGRPRVTDRLAAVVLALPFLIGIAALRGLTVALAIFHGSDERFYHYPTILRFSHQLPFPDFHRYPAAQTPLFHLLMAWIGKVVGYEIWRLRLVEALITYLLALAVYALLHKRLGMARGQALALSLLFALSPYVLGGAFRLETDNLAMLFSVLVLERLERFRQTGRALPFGIACLCLCAAVLTRQSTGFLCLVAAGYVAWSRPALSWRWRVGGLGLVGLALVPAALLFLNWHGLVPVGGDPSSCGLCSAAGRPGVGGTGLEIQTAELALATIGIYGAVLFAPLLARQVLERSPGARGAWLKQSSAGPLVGALAGVVLLLVFPATPGGHAAGDVWKAAAKLPLLNGTSLLFWVLVPLSGGVLWARLRTAEARWLSVLLATTFVATAIVIRFPWQKYVDPFALLILLVTVRPAELASPRLLLGALVLALAFVAYLVDTGAHRSTVATRVSVPTAARTVALGSDTRNALQHLTRTQRVRLLGGSLLSTVGGQIPEH